MTATHKILLFDARCMLSIWMATHPNEVQPADRELIARLDAAIEADPVLTCCDTNYSNPDDYRTHLRVAHGVKP